MPREVPIHMLEIQEKRLIIIAKMKAQITKSLCPVRHVASNYAWLKRETVFEVSLVVSYHNYIVYYKPFLK